VSKSVSQLNSDCEKNHSRLMGWDGMGWVDGRVDEMHGSRTRCLLARRDRIDGAKRRMSEWGERECLTWMGWVGRGGMSRGMTPTHHHRFLPLPPQTVPDNGWVIRLEWPYPDHTTRAFRSSNKTGF